MSETRKPQEQWVVVHFLTPGLGEDRLRIYGPFDSKAEASDSPYNNYSRATRMIKLVQLASTR